MQGKRKQRSVSSAKKKLSLTRPIRDRGAGQGARSGGGRGAAHNWEKSRTKCIRRDGNGEANW
jgi:hypothetical protein